MGKTIFAAVVAAVLASVATVLVMNSLGAGKSAAEKLARETADDTARVERERLARRVEEVEKRVAAVPRAERRAAAPEETPAPAAAPAAGAPAIAPDGTPYVSRAELEEFAKSRGGNLGLEAAAALEAAKPVEKKTIEEIARDQGLSAGEEASLLIILRESEEEMVHSLFGDRSMDDIKSEVLEAKEDPDKQAALMQGLVQNAIGNVGKIMTLENRTKKKVENLLGAERAAKLLGTPRKPVIAPEFEDIFDGF